MKKRNKKSVICRLHGYKNARFIKKKPNRNLKMGIMYTHKIKKQNND